MNIALDMSPLKSGHYLQHRVRGTGFYLQNLWGSLEKYYPNNKYICFNREDSLRGNIDIVHYPYFEPFFLTLPWISRNKSVVTVHDLTPLVFPKNFRVGLRGALKWQIQKNALRNVSAIITDSLSSKKDIIKYAGINKDKVRVVYLAAGEEFVKLNDAKLSEQDLRRKYDLPNKFVLYVGDVTWNKNLPRLIKAIKKINVPLVMVGQTLVKQDIDFKNPWNKDLAEVLSLIGGDDKIIRLGFVPKEDLVMLYNTATVFAMPSLYEGFGLPILEAMSCGCPVVTSKEGSIPEITADSSINVDAYDTESISQGISKLLNNHQLREKLASKGIEQAQKFTWRKTADETMGVYRETVANSSLQT